MLTWSHCASNIFRISPRYLIHPYSSQNYHQSKFYQCKIDICQAFQLIFLLGSFQMLIITQEASVHCARWVAPAATKLQSSQLGYIPKISTCCHIIVSPPCRKWIFAKKKSVVEKSYFDLTFNDCHIHIIFFETNLLTCPKNVTNVVKLSYLCGPMHQKPIKNTSNFIYKSAIKISIMYQFLLILVSFTCSD